MTDFKPYSAIADEPQVGERSVAVVLSIPTEAEDASQLSLRAIGNTSLARIALECLVRVEADELWLHSSNPAVAELFHNESWPGVTLLQGDSLAQPSCSHLLLLGPYHPFLRASTIGEAVRLFKIRPDIATLASCTRSRDALYDEAGVLVLPDDDERAVYREAHAFQILPRTPRSKSGMIDPYPFELSTQEGFFVDSTFEFELAAAWHERRQQRSEH